MSGKKNISTLNSTIFSAPITSDSLATADYYVYCIIIPTLLCLGIPGNILTFFSILKYSCSQISYTYMAVLNLNVALCLVTCCFVLGNDHWFSDSYFDFLQRNKFWVEVEAHFVDPFCNVLATTSCLIDLFCCVERFLAIYKPILYRTLPKKCAIVVSIVGGYVLSSILCISDTFRQYVIYNPKRLVYELVENKDYMNMLAPQVLIGLRGAVRIAAVFSIVALNVLILKKFRRQNLVRKNMLIAGTGMNENERKSHETEKILLIRLTLHSTLVSIGQIPIAIDYILKYTDPDGGSSNGRKIFGFFSDLTFFGESCGTCLVFWCTVSLTSASVNKIRYFTSHH